MSNWCRRLLFMALAMLMPLGLMLPSASAQQVHVVQEVPTPDPSVTSEEPAEDENAETSTPESENVESPSASESGSASPELETTEPEETTLEPEPEASPSVSPTPEEGTADQSIEPFEAQNMAPSATSGAVDCSYAGDGSGGQYRDTLCWFDFSYLLDGVAQPLTTEWEQVQEGPNTESISRSEFLQCDYRSLELGGIYRRSTVEYRSVMGADYGTITLQGCGSSALFPGIAEDRSLSQLENHRDAIFSNPKMTLGTITD